MTHGTYFLVVNSDWPVKIMFFLNYSSCNTLKCVSLI